MGNLLSMVTLCLLFIVSSPAATIFYDSGDPPQGSGPGLFSDEWVAQPFTATGAWQMDTLGVFAGGSQAITMVLAQDASGLPGLVLSTWTISKNDWDPGGSWGYTNATFSFTQGTNYWFEYTSTADFFSGDLLPVPAPNGGPDIAFSFDQGASWIAAAGAGSVGLRIEATGALAVPEPKPWLLLLASLGGMGMVSRGRRLSAFGPLASDGGTRCSRL